MTANALLEHLHRGGRYAYLWTKFDGDTFTTKDDEIVNAGRSLWYRVGATPIVPYDWPDFVPRDIRDWPALYFGVHPANAPRTLRQRATYATVSVCNCLYADFDAKDFSDGFNGIQRRLDNAPLYPSAVVNSGGGLHTYWIFEAPVFLATDEIRRRMARAQRLWTDAIVMSDGAAKDLPRILRMPGSLNRKYDPVRPVELVEFNERRVFPLAVIGAVLRPAIELEEYKQMAGGGEDDEDDDTSWNDLLRWAKSVANPQGGRHGMALYLAYRLRKAGAPQSVAEEIVEKYVDDVIRDRPTTGEARRIVTHEYR